ncbi:MULTISPECIES: hypothetical protein [Psychrilyobacter]|uniref:Uncharacterized protein n=1 Tax=Psychrilyobacter piezotolerans TaxID=2293438 RepID=A0ABX9KGA5_9FUSO|nr:MULTISPECIES: hypothetical protein [Psychrilyobacter]MCS5420962.1 hypothetical protein [Psychrilyobacter sp. S5]NDI78288.1 hypothetical protein [Psychrilyobacter piezotolerans]RDE60862.1 hypothetical protein DV867_10115 [Psychrilyobacter sp. S5]REI40651.1 hypothetical protein DYH56_10115 [Psychrilyobacter piezotolerans]
MNISRKNNNGYIVRVIEKITEEGTFITEKRVVNKEELALEAYGNLLEKYPDLKIECFNYKTGEMLNKNF